MTSTAHTRLHSDHTPSNWDGNAQALERAWTDRTRVVLTPIAAPSILGLFGFMAATTMVAAWMAGWYGDAATPTTVWPLALTLGGIAQLVAAVWCYRARDGVGTAMHGVWGSFWLGFGILAAFAAAGLHPPLLLATDPSFAWWFIVLAAITGMGALASLGHNLAMFATLAALTTGSVFAALAFYGVGASWTFTTAGWVLVGSAGAAFYTASALMLAESFGRTVLPTGALSRDANIPTRKPLRPMEYPLGMPGSKVGQ